MNPPFEIVRVAGVIGAEIRGLDLKRELEDNVRQALRAAWLEHLVLFFPGQFLSATELRRFAGYWGTLEATDAGATKPIVNNVLMQEAPGVVELAASIDDAPEGRQIYWPVAADNPPGRGDAGAADQQARRAICH